jgi:predicted nuclease with TOPRIM domain
MADIPGIEKVRTMKTTHSRSMPPNMDEPYIEMYVLSKEKERLENEGTRLDTRREWIVGRLQEIEKEMERLGKQDKKSQKKRQFDCDAKWVKVKKEADPEEPKKEEPKKTKIETGWKIKTLNMKKQKR